MGGGLGMWKRRREGKLKHEGEGEEGAAAGEERDLELACQKKKVEFFLFEDNLESFLVSLRVQMRGTNLEFARAKECWPRGFVVSWVHSAPRGALVPIQRQVKHMRLKMQ
jgi:hypothetical protein